MKHVISLSEARASLSSIGSEVARTGATYVVTVRNKPAFLIKPLKVKLSPTHSMRGVLAGYADPGIREREHLAGSYHAEERYGDTA